MSKREKILLIGVLGAALYGLYAVLSPGSAAPSIIDQAHLAQLKAFAANVDLQIEIRKPNRFETMITELSGSEWSHDPFHRGLLPGEEAPEEADEEKAPKDVPLETAQPRIRVAYTGYLAAGDRRLAIVDGVRYAEGDELINAPFTVMTIAPDKVTLLSTTDETRIEALLEE